MLEKLRRTLGFVLLLLSSLTYMGLTDTNGANFAVWIGYLLMIFAWTDYFSFVIYTFPAFGAIAGFLAGGRFSSAHADRHLPPRNPLKYSPSA